jgi:hypothetical protein
MAEQRYTSTHLLALTGPATGLLYLYFYISKISFALSGVDFFFVAQ